MKLVRLRLETLFVIGVLALIAGVFLSVSAKNPPGFFRDESAIAYNAYTLSTTGKDEYGARLPLFIRSFDDYKSPLYVYLLAAVFRLTGPSTAVARTFSAVLGLAAILVLYALALGISRRPMLALAVAAIAGLSPWLFEISRLVFEVALMPLLLASFLLAVFRASAGTWRLRRSIWIGLLLAAIVYTYQVGRVLAPLLAVGLVLCWFRGRWRQLAVVWAVFLAALAPIGVWARVHPGAFEARFHGSTYIHEGMSGWEICRQALSQYAKNIDLWAWLVHGDGDVAHHVHGAGSLFFVEVALALAGTVVILLRRRSDPWWRFVLYAVLVSPVAAAFTQGTVNALRMIALPVLFPLLALPALDLLTSLPRPRAQTATVAALTAVFAVEAVHWHLLYERHGPRRLASFEADARPVIDAAFARGGTVYAFRLAHGPYIDTLLYGAIEGRSRSSIVVLDGIARPPAGALFVGAEGECAQCPRLNGSDGFETLMYKPAPPGVLRTAFQLNSPLLGVGSPLELLVGVENTSAVPADHVMLIVRLPVGMRLAGPPYHDRGAGCTGSSTIECNIGYLPGDTGAGIRYEVRVTQGGPQTMTARAGSDLLDINPVGTGSAFTVNLSPPAYARSSPAPG